MTEYCMLNCWIKQGNIIAGNNLELACVNKLHKVYGKQFQERYLVTPLLLLHTHYLLLDGHGDLPYKYRCLTLLAVTHDNNLIN